MIDQRAGLSDGERTQQILEERARALARPLHAEETADSVEMVVVTMGTEDYGIDARHVLEVLSLADVDVAPVPGIPAFWSGLINVRGSLHPVLDMRRYLSLPDAAATDRPRGVVLVCAAGLTVGMIVDDAPEVRRVPTATIGPALAGVTQALRETVRGVTHDLLTVLDVEALLADPTLVVREEPT